MTVEEKGVGSKDHPNITDDYTTLMLIGRIDGTTQQILTHMKTQQKKLDELEVRTRDLETSKAKLAGIAAGSAAVVTFIINYIPGIFR